jgi:hypothetical protein
MYKFPSSLNFAKHNIRNFPITLCRKYTVTYISIAGQRLGKHIPAQVNALKSTTSIARQRISKHASLTIEIVFSVKSVQTGYKIVFGGTEQ